MDLGLLRAGLSWVWRVEDLLHLLKGLACGFHKEEVDGDELDANPGNVDQVKLPSDLCNTDTDTVGIDHHGNVEEEEVESGTLGTGTVLETFDSVEGLEGGETPSEDNTEQEDRDDNSVCEIRGFLC